MERKVLKTVKIEVEFEVIVSNPYGISKCADCCFKLYVNCPDSEHCSGGYLRVKDNK